MKRLSTFQELNAKASHRPVFVVHYDPRLPSITSIVRRHQRSVVNQDTQMRDIFPMAPLVAYKVAPNLRAKLIRAKVPETVPTRPKRQLKGMIKCGKPSDREWGEGNSYKLQS